ncbi:MAG: hypothetical protein QXI16_00740 [Sulfolobaceae archaeon]
MKKQQNIEELLKQEVYNIITNYKKIDLEELSKAKIASEIAISYLKTDKELHKEDNYGEGLDE